MPKALTIKQDSASGPMASGSSHPNVLRRNQVCFISGLTVPVLTVSVPSKACHQCRRRKLVRHHHRVLSSQACRSSSIGTEVVIGPPSFSSIVVVSRLTLFFSSDAHRPCSTCVRSHAHALSHAPPGVILPERPECTFDEGEFFPIRYVAYFNITVSSRWRSWGTRGS